MKSINIKKAATIAAGAVMLAGAAFAVTVPDEAAEPGFYWDDATGNVNAQVVLGSSAAAIDGVQAAKFAGFLGSKAWVAAGEAETKTILGSDISVDCSVSIESSGVDTEYPEDSVKKDVAWNAGLSSSALELTVSENMIQDTIDYRGTDYDFEESVVAGDGTIDLKYEEGDVFHGVFFTSANQKKYYYKLDFIDPFPIEDPEETIELPFLGEQYVINALDVDKIELVKGTTLEMSLGQQTDFSVGNDTYTITLKDVGYYQSSDEGWALIEVIKGGGMSTVKLKEGESKAIEGLTVYVQAAGESYSSGTQGAATLRVGGQALELEDGEPFPGYDDWEVDLVTTEDGDAPSGSSADEFVDYIMVYFDGKLDDEDEITVIPGPNDYFSLEYVGTQIDHESGFELDTITIRAAAEEDSDPYADKFWYTPKDSSSEYPITLNDGDEMLAFLASDAAGLIGNSTSGTLFNMTEGDFFFVDNTPVEILGVWMKSGANAGDAYVKFEEKAGGAGSRTTTVKADDCTKHADGWATCAATLLQNPVSFNFTFNSTVLTAEPDVVNVYSGADNILETEYAYIDWQHMDNQSTEIVGPGAFLTTVKADSRVLTFGYINGTDNDGCYLNDSVDGAYVVNQATSDDADEDNMYYMSAVYFAEADSDEAILDIPEEALEMRALLTKSAMTVSEGGITKYTFPNIGGSLKNFTCAAEDKTYTLPPTGVTFGTVGTDIVILDTDTPRGNAVILGGHSVNSKAKGETEGTLTASGDTYVAKSGTNVFVAGWTGQNTAEAIDALISAIKGKMA